MPILRNTVHDLRICLGRHVIATRRFSSFRAESRDLRRERWKRIDLGELKRLNRSIGARVCAHANQSGALRQPSRTACSTIVVRSSASAESRSSATFLGSSSTACWSSSGAHLDQDLVRPRRRRCVKFTRSDVAAEAVDAGRPHGACHSGFRCPYAL